MIYELAEFDIKEGMGTAFEEAVAQAQPLFRRARGCLSMRLGRVLERPNTYHLVIAWETLENHTVDFRESADFLAWRALVSPFFAAPPRVEHTAGAVAGFGH